MAKDDRAQLEGWIAGSQRFRRRLTVVMAIAAVIAFAIWMRWSMAGGIALLLVGAVYGAGLWITFAHITDWRARIALLEARARQRARS